jgi:hypothetical protein
MRAQGRGVSRGRIHLAAGQFGMVGPCFPRLQSDDKLSSILARIKHCD